MNSNMLLKFIFCFSTLFLFSCQQNIDQKNYYSKIDINQIDKQTEIEGLSENHGQIDLSQSTLEQQKIDKQKAAENLQNARNERIEIEVENSIDLSDEVNVAKYARDTIHKKGEKLFTRIGLNIYNNWNQCSKFKTKDDAQRKFLKSGGPYSDKFNLDPDGDGFACDWDPEVYRGLTIPED